MDSSSTAELVTESQLRRTMERLTRDLGTIRTEIQDGTRTLEDAFARAEEKYSDSIEALLRSLEDRYADVLSSVAERSAERITHLTESYERQIELIQRMLNEAMVATRVAEETKERRTKIGRVLGENKIDPRDILKHTTETMMSLELTKRYELLYSLYTKIFFPFSEFLDSSDLSSVSQYVNDIKVPAPWRTELGDFNGHYFGWGYRAWPEWCYYNLSEINRAVSYGAQIMHLQGAHFNSPAGGGACRFWISSIYAGTVATERERINAIIRKEKTDYEEATHKIFPSEIFTRLVGKINGMFREFI